jgi:LPS sulfotransferase NodH
MGWNKRNRSRYIIASGGRSGTGLLAHALWSTGVLGRPEEYFNEADLAAHAHQWRVNTPETEEDSAAYLKAYKKASSTPNGVSGLKVMTGSLSTIGQLVSAEAAASPTEILLTLGITMMFLVVREDRIAAAMSTWRAKQTGEFKRFEGSEAVSSEGFGKPSDETIQGLLNDSYWAETQWNSVDPERIPVHRFVYEEFSEDVPGTVAQIADHLGVRRPEVPPGARLPVRIQDDHFAKVITEYKQRHAHDPPHSIPPPPDRH